MRTTSRKPLKRDITPGDRQIAVFTSLMFIINSKYRKKLLSICHHLRRIPASFKIGMACFYYQICPRIRFKCLIFGADFHELIIRGIGPHCNLAEASGEARDFLHAPERRVHWVIIAVGQSSFEYHAFPSSYWINFVRNWMWLACIFF